MILIDTTEINLYAISPILVPIFFGFVLLLLCAFLKSASRSLYTALSLLAILLYLGCLLALVPGGNSFYSLFSFDGFSFLAQLLLLLSSAMFLALRYASIKDDEPGEFYALFMFMLAGFMLMCSSFNLILLFVALETASLSLYTMIALRAKNSSVEAAVKYFSLGALSAGFFTLGAALLYLATKSLDLVVIFENIVKFDIKHSVFVYVGAIFLVLSIGFKLSIVPMHSWVGDVYRGAGFSLAGFISVAPKIAASILAIRVFYLLNEAGVGIVAPLLCALAIITMSVANFAALSKRRLSQILAYSSISHAGFILAAISIGSKDASTAMLYYWLVLIFANLALFCLLAMLPKDYDELSALAGLGHSKPLFAICASLFFITLAGVPPFGVFWAKMLLISTAFSSGFTALAIAMVLNSAIAVAYYLRPVGLMLAKEGSAKPELNTHILSSTALVLSAVLVVLGFIFGDFILGFITLNVDIFEF